MTVEDNSHAGQGAVVLDIGGTVGALLVRMPAAMLGREVEICPAGPRPDGHVPHVAVIARPTAGGPVPCLVYPELSEGEYQLNERYRDEVVLTAVVVGGEVTEAVWPASYDVSGALVASVPHPHDHHHDADHHHGRDHHHPHHR
jgi:hypothetical protein